MIYIISQVLAIIATSIDFFSRALRRKRGILLFNVCSTIVCVTSYILLKSPLAAIANFILIVRGIVYLYLDKNDKPFGYYALTFSALIAVMAASLGVFWKDPWDLLMLASVCICTICFAFKNMYVVRISMIVSSVMWFTYNATLHAYVNMACDCINISIVLGAMLIYQILPAIKQKKEDAAFRIAMSCCEKDL